MWWEQVQVASTPPGESAFIGAQVEFLASRASAPSSADLDLAKGGGSRTIRSEAGAASRWAVNQSKTFAAVISACQTVAVGVLLGLSRPRSKALFEADDAGRAGLGAMQRERALVAERVEHASAGRACLATAGMLLARWSR